MGTLAVRPVSMRSSTTSQPPPSPTTAGGLMTVVSFARALASRCKFFPAHGNFRGVGGGGHGHFSWVARRRCRSKSWLWRSFAQPCSPPGGASTSSVSCGRSHCSASAGDRRATGHAGSRDGLPRRSMISYALIKVRRSAVAVDCQFR